MALSPERDLLASGPQDKVIFPWDLPTRREVPRIYGHKGTVNAVARRRDGARLVSGSADSTVKLWDAAASWGAVGRATLSKNGYPIPRDGNGATPGIRGATMEDKVREALENIRMYLQADGGDVELVEVTEDGVVRVRLVGACHGCPMAAMTLRNTIEQLLKDQVPEVVAVEAA